MKRPFKRHKLRLAISALQAIQRASDASADDLRDWARGTLKYLNQAPEPPATKAEIAQETSKDRY